MKFYLIGLLFFLKVGCCIELVPYNYNELSTNPYYGLDITNSNLIIVDKVTNINIVSNRYIWLWEVVYFDKTKSNLIWYTTNFIFYEII